MRRVQRFAASLLLLGGAAQRRRSVPDTTEDGLVRAPSSSQGGRVSRAWRRVHPIPAHRFGARSPVTFRKNLGAQECQRTEALPIAKHSRGHWRVRFASELVAELVERGGYRIAESRRPDTLRVDAVHPRSRRHGAGSRRPSHGPHGYLVRSAGSMKLIVELRDGASGATHRPHHRLLEGARDDRNCSSPPR